MEDEIEARLFCMDIFMGFEGNTQREFISRDAMKDILSKFLNYSWLSLDIPIDNIKISQEMDSLFEETGFIDFDKYYHFLRSKRLDQFGWEISKKQYKKHSS